MTFYGARGVRGTPGPTGEEAVVSSRERRSAAVAVDTLGERQRDKTNDYICCCGRKWQLDRIKSEQD